MSRKRNHRQGGHAVMPHLSPGMSAVPRSDDYPVEGVVIRIRGKDWVFGPLSLNFIQREQKRLSSFKHDFSAESIEIMQKVAHESLLYNYPGIPREETDALLDVANMVDIFNAACDAGGLRRKQQEAEQGDKLGETRQSGRTPRETSTGTTSTATSASAPGGVGSMSEVESPSHDWPR